MAQEPKRIVMLNYERMQRAKTAMLTQAPKQDQYRLGDTWFNVADAWKPGQAVEEVNHFGRHRTVVGDVLTVERVDHVVLAHIQVLSIEMAETNSLTDADIHALGYESAEEFAADWGEAVAGKVWLMRIAHITPQASVSTTLQ